MIKHYLQEYCDSDPEILALEVEKYMLDHIDINPFKCRGEAPIDLELGKDDNGRKFIKIYKRVED